MGLEALANLLRTGQLKAEPRNDAEVHVSVKTSARMSWCWSTRGATPCCKQSGSKSTF